MLQEAMAVSTEAYYFCGYPESAVGPGGPPASTWSLGISGVSVLCDLHKGKRYVENSLTDSQLNLSA